LTHGYAASTAFSHLGDRSSIGGGHLRTLQRRGRARLGPEGRHSLANAVRQYELLPQLDIRSSLGAAGIVLQKEFV